MSLTGRVKPGNYLQIIDTVLGSLFSFKTFLSVSLLSHGFSYLLCINDLQIYLFSPDLPASIKPSTLSHFSLKFPSECLALHLNFMWQKHHSSVSCLKSLQQEPRQPLNIIKFYICLRLVVERKMFQLIELIFY